MQNRACGSARFVVEHPDIGLYSSTNAWGCCECALVVGRPECAGGLVVRPRVGLGVGGVVFGGGSCGVRGRVFGVVMGAGSSPAFQRSATHSRFG